MHNVRVKFLNKLKKIIKKTSTRRHQYVNAHIQHRPTARQPTTHTSHHLATLNVRLKSQARDTYVSTTNLVDHFMQNNDDHTPATTASTLSISNVLDDSFQRRPIGTSHRRVTHMDISNSHHRRTP